MYVALRDTFDVYPDKKPVKRWAGDEVETFHTWPAINQMAALSARIVREVPDGELNLKKAFEPQDRAEITIAKSRAFEKVLAKQPTPVAQPEPQKAVAAPVAAADSVEIEEIEPFGCELCDYVGGSARGLAIHKGSAHKG